MASKQEMRSEETKRAILTAAGELFSKRGYDTVSIREIAKAAGCSHTTLYIYFKDKEALLHQLSEGPLQGLSEQMDSMLQDHSLAPEDRLRQISLLFIRFALANRTMYTLFFMTKATRIDVDTSESQLQKLRNHLFDLFRRAVLNCLPAEGNQDDLLAYARIYFYTLQGIVGTYTQSEETLEELMERLTSTFELTVDVMLLGMVQHANKGEDLK
ncbi:TetR/AcrR family transcriptional regulator [Brevibacillus reuszeri]|uniref:TetR/AcrR family transcriptional regulator n=1 Tax=Brevibacillus reuszeri TaxID=54915 RepID=UPI003D2267E4